MLELSITDGSVFNPLAPCGARPPSNAGTIFVDYFQSTRPLRGETHKDPQGRKAKKVFNPLAPCGARRATMQPVENTRNSFSIHSPLAGRDHTANTTTSAYINFQSTRPLRGETFPALSQPQIDYFSIHSPLAGRDMFPVIASTMLCNFQSTRPLRGETISLADCTMTEAIFNPLAPCGARLGGCYPTAS